MQPGEQYNEANAAKADDASKVSNRQVAARVAKRSCDDKHSTTARVVKKGRNNEFRQDHVAPNPHVNLCSGLTRHNINLLSPQGKFDLGGQKKLGGTLQTSNASKRIPADKSKSAAARKNLDQQDTIQKPKRSMSAYNFFFKEERSKIAAALSGAKTRDEIKEVLESLGARKIQLDQPSITPSNLLMGRKKMFNGFVSFEDIGKIIGYRWRSIDKESLAKCSALSKEDTLRYQDEMQTYYDKCKASKRAQLLVSLSTKKPSPVELDGAGLLLASNNVQSEHQRTIDSHDFSSIHEIQALRRLSTEHLRPSMVSEDEPQVHRAVLQCEALELALLKARIPSNPSGLESGLSFETPSQTNSIIMPIGGISNLGSYHHQNSILDIYNNIPHILDENNRQTIFQQSLSALVNFPQQQSYLSQEAPDLFTSNSLPVARSAPLYQQPRACVGLPAQGSDDRFNANYFSPAGTMLPDTSFVTFAAICELAPLLRQGFQLTTPLHSSMEGVSSEALQLLLLALNNNNNANDRGTNNSGSEPESQLFS